MVVVSQFEMAPRRRADTATEWTSLTTPSIELAMGCEDRTPEVSYVVIFLEMPLACRSSLWLAAWAIGRIVMNHASTSCLPAGPFVGDRRRSAQRSFTHQRPTLRRGEPSRSTGREARPLRSADRTQRRISTPAGPPRRELCLALVFSPFGETPSSRLSPWRRLDVRVDPVASSRYSFGRPLRTKGTLAPDTSASFR